MAAEGSGPTPDPGQVPPARSAWLALAIAVCLAACTGSAERRSGVTEVDRPLPRLAGEAVGGGSIDVADLRGEVLVVNVWATWCGPCRREQPALQRLAERYDDRGVAFLGLNYNDDLAAARAWIEEFGVTYPSLADPSGAFADDLGFPALPDTYVVDADGTIRFQVFGETDERELGGLIDEVLARG